MCFANEGKVLVFIKILIFTRISTMNTIEVMHSKLQWIRYVTWRFRIGYLCAVPTVMEHQDISRLCTLDELGQRVPNVDSSGFGLGWITVQHHQNVFLHEPKTLNEQVVHSTDIIGTAMQLALGSWVVAPH